MDRENAIKYLDRKEKIDISKGKFTKEDEEEIEEVIKKGKIYGDPLAIIQ